MRVLVTGGAGFIGSNIVSQLLDPGDEPVVLDDLSSGFAENLLPEVPFVEGDVRDAAAVAGAMKDCDVGHASRRQRRQRPLHRTTQ